MKAVLFALLMLVPGVAWADAIKSGRYEGIGDGGKLFVDVNDDHFKIETGAVGCGGSGQGLISSVSPGHWTVALKDSGMSCTLEIQLQGADRINIVEHDCRDFHGFACSFDGFVYGK